jgi:DNA-binding NarL/FixJ family response regulator
VQSAAGKGCRVIVSLPRKLHRLEDSTLSNLRVLIVDDQPLFRNGLRYLLQSRAIQVVGEAADGEQAIQLVQELRPDMVLMDYHMPGMDGLLAAQKIKKGWPEVKILILTVDQADGILVDSIRAGADGYLPKEIEANRLFEVLESLMRGEPAFASEMAAQTLVTLARQQGAEDLSVQFPALTPRQREILTLMSTDLTNREIGQRMFLSEAAIKYHVGQIFEVLGVRSRQEAIQLVRKKGRGSWRQNLY